MDLQNPELRLFRSLCCKLGASTHQQHGSAESRAPTFSKALLQSQVLQHTNSMDLQNPELRLFRRLCCKVKCLNTLTAWICRIPSSDFFEGSVAKSSASTHQQHGSAESRAPTFSKALLKRQVLQHTNSMDLQNPELRLF